MMAKMPKRRKSKDNPYKLEYDEKNNKYMVIFKDNKNLVHKLEISENIYLAFDKFELEDISQMHKYDRHIEHSEVYEETLYRRSINIPISTEEKVEMKILQEELKTAINQLSEVQKKRLIKYYFENKTFEEIAKEENCSKVAVKYSIDIALKNISKKIKF